MCYMVCPGVDYITLDLYTFCVPTFSTQNLVLVGKKTVIYHLQCYFTLKHCILLSGNWNLDVYRVPIIF